MRIRRYAETGTLSCGRAERPTELASQVHPTLGMVLLEEQVVRGIGIARQLVPKKRYLLIGTRVLTECGIARHPGPKIIESLTELESCAFFRGIGIAIKIDSRNWHREGNCSRNLASWKAFAELASQ